MKNDIKKPKVIWILYFDNGETYHFFQKKDAILEYNEYRDGGVSVIPPVKYAIVEKIKRAG